MINCWRLDQPTLMRFCRCKLLMEPCIALSAKAMQHIRYCNARVEHELAYVGRLGLRVRGPDDDKVG